MTNSTIERNTQAHRFQLNKLTCVGPSEKINSCHFPALNTHNFRFLILFDGIFTFELREMTDAPWCVSAVCMRRRARENVERECYVAKATSTPWNEGENEMPRRSCYILCTRECGGHFCRSHSLNIPKINNNYSRWVNIFRGYFFCLSPFYFIIALRL